MAATRAIPLVMKQAAIERAAAIAQQNDAVVSVTHPFRIDRIMYGSDFPNIPYAWDRELKWLRDSSLSEYDLERILNKNATDFFDLNK